MPVANLAQRETFSDAVHIEPAPSISPSENGNTIVSASRVIRLATLPPVLGGRHWTAGSLDADESALDVTVRDAQPDIPTSSQCPSALVLRLGAGHGQVSVELFTGRLSVSVGAPFAKKLQTAAGTEPETGWTGAPKSEREHIDKKHC